MQTSLLSAAIEATLSVPEEENHLGRFLKAPTAREALTVWFDGRPGPEDREELVLRLTAEIAYLDELITDQVNAILHHEGFQGLEASWRGLHHLVEEIEEGDNIKVRVLAVSWRELVRDLDKAIEFDQSSLFSKVYGEEFDTPGGEPFGVLLGDYSIRHRPTKEHPYDDLSALQAISEVAAAAFAPFVAAVHPSFFGLESFVALERPIDLERVFRNPEYTKWESLRNQTDSRFAGLLLPRMLLRRKYEDDLRRVDGFRFREQVGSPDGSGYLWGNPVYGLGTTLVRAFAESGWLAGIRGVERDVEGGGLVSDLPVDYFSTDVAGVAPKPSTEVVITDAREKELSDLGFISLCQCAGTDLSAFYATPSIQRPKRFDSEQGKTNARLSAMLQYMFCVSRFAHYIKVIGRDRVGSFATTDECERYLNKWLKGFTTANDDASTEQRAKYPLRSSKVSVRELPGRPGVFSSIIHLQPHFQLDQMSASIQLVTELTAAQEV